MKPDYQDALNRNFDVSNTQGVEINASESKRLDTDYTNKDFDWYTGIHSGDIYISTPDQTHDLIVNHHNHMHEAGYDGKYDLPENKYPGTSGFFTNEETASRSFTETGKFDSVQLGHDLQQAPHYDNSIAMKCEAQCIDYFPEYNKHLDCFRVNEEKMLENYGTIDFYDVQAKCLENTAWGEGGGHQGYNPYINQMINNGALEYLPEKSRTSDSNQCLDYAERKAQAKHEASVVNDHIESRGIKGEAGQRIGYNEISQSSNLTSTSTNQNIIGISSSNIESTGGGGSRAPNASSDPTVNGNNLLSEGRPRGGPQSIESIDASKHAENAQKAIDPDNNLAANAAQNAQKASSSISGGVTP